MTVRRALWLLFALFIVYGGTIPFHFASSTGAVIDKLRELPVNPLVSPETGRRLSIPDVVQNVLLFLPFGALGFLAGDRKRVIRRVAIVALLGVALSVLVEGLQLLMINRIASLGDVICNSAGAFLGAILAWQFQGLVAAGLGRLRREGLADVDELGPFAIASLVLVVAFWQPFDVTLEVGTIAGKVRNLELDVWQFRTLRDEGISIVLCAFFSTTLASYLSVLGERNAARTTLVTGVLVVFFLEGAQIFVGSRMPGLWDASVAAAGVAVGVAVWSMASRILWPRLWLGVLVALTGIAAALQMLTPFDIASDYRPVRWFPFLGYYARTTFETLSHVIELMLLYFPLGFWLGRSKPTGRGALVTACLLTLAVAGPVEYLQGWIVGRYPDVSDLGVSLFGAWLGVRAGQTRMSAREIPGQ